MGHQGNRVVGQAASQLAWGKRDPNLMRRIAPQEATPIQPEQIQSELINLLGKGLEVSLSEKLNQTAEEAGSEIIRAFERMKAQIAATKMQSIEIKTERTSVEILGLRHKQFERLLKIVAGGFASMMVGTAGTGKTFAAEQVAKALDLKFYAMSVSSQTSESKIFGYNDANGIYHRTMFREAFEHGGVFLMDEIDAGNANVLVGLNAALAGHYCGFPDGMVEKHKDFRFIATANTFGTGASRQYIGRNQIDAATLDRFVTIEWIVDTVLEANMVQHLTNGPRWHKVVMDVRKYVDDGGHRVVVSPRATLKGATLLDDGFELQDVIAMVLLPTAPADQQTIIRNKAIAAWGGFA